MGTWKCKLCGAIMVFNDHLTRCPMCGGARDAVPGDTASDTLRVSLRHQTDGVPLLKTRIAHLFRFLDLPPGDIPYVLDQRPDPLPGEAEFPLDESPIWPASGTLILGRFVLLQQYFMKYPDPELMRPSPSIFGFPTALMHKLKSVGASAPGSPGYRWYTESRKIIFRHIFCSLGSFLLVLALFALPFLYPILVLERGEAPRLALVAVLLFCAFLVPIPLLLLKRWFELNSRRAEMRRQALRFLAWAKERASIPC